MTFKAVALDLDDTLIDTSGEIVPAAAKATFEAMKKKGLNTSFDQFEADRKLGALSISHKLIFRQLAEKYGAPGSVEEITETGILHFYNPALPEKLGLLPGAFDNLIYLKKKYPLFLVTSGAPNAQREKVKRAHLEPHFQKIYFIDGVTKKRKGEAFQEILDMLKIKPAELLSVGNRLSQEIHDAKELGCQTCYFKYGEHVGEEARNQFEIPDFTILKHTELISVCRL